MISVPENRAMEIAITQAANGGFIVQVGCERFIFQGDTKSINEMCDEIAEYLKDPKGYEKAFRLQRNRNERIMAQENIGACDVAPPTRL